MGWGGGWAPALCLVLGCVWLGQGFSVPLPYMIRLLVIDNRDSFVYNIVQLLRELPDISYELRQAEALAGEQLKGYDGLILSPGPGLPGD